MDQAFNRLRNYARTNRTLLTEIAAALVDGSLHIDALVDTTRQQP